jgi:hypothetical protein
MPFEHLKGEVKSLELYGIELNGKEGTAELRALIARRDIVRFAKAQRKRRLGQVERLSEERTLKRILKGSLFFGRKEGRGEGEKEEGRNKHVQDVWTVW